MSWVEPSISLRWGPYTRLDGDEQSKVVEMTTKAKDAGLLTKRMALEKFAAAGVFEIDDIEAALDAIEKEQAETDKRAADKAAAQAENDALTLHAAGAKNASGKPGAAGKPSGPQEAPAD